MNSENTSKPGRKEDRLKIESDSWEDAVKQALDKRKPKAGWPEPEETKGKTEDD